jgi:hypothetical protein
MPNLTIGSRLPPVPSPTRSDSARAAQRAFFQAAVNGAAPVKTTAPVHNATAAGAASPVKPAHVATAAAASEPTRYARPGSILDIKV